jgi:hypothetical protein
MPIRFLCLNLFYFSWLCVVGSILIMFYFHETWRNQRERSFNHWSERCLRFSCSRVFEDEFVEFKLTTSSISCINLCFLFFFYETCCDRIERSSNHWSEWCSRSSCSQLFEDESVFEDQFVELKLTTSSMSCINLCFFSFQETCCNRRERNSNH